MFCWRSGRSSTAARRRIISRLGAARPDSRKLTCRWGVSAAAARATCDSPRRSRHQRSRAPKSPAGATLLPDRPVTMPSPWGILAHPGGEINSLPGNSGAVSLSPRGEECRVVPEVKHAGLRLRHVRRPARRERGPAPELPDLRGRAPVRRLERPAVDDAARDAREGLPERAPRRGSRPHQHHDRLGLRHRPAGAPRPGPGRQRAVGLHQLRRRRDGRGGARARRPPGDRHLPPALLRDVRGVEPGVRRRADLHPRRRPPVGDAAEPERRPLGGRRREALPG